MTDDSPLLDEIERRVAESEYADGAAGADERAVCRAHVVRECERWTQRARVDETWTYAVVPVVGESYICDPCLGRLENYVPTDAEVGHYDRAIERLRKKDSGDN